MASEYVGLSESELKSKLTKWRSRKSLAGGDLAVYARRAAMAEQRGNERGLKTYSAKLTQCKRDIAIASQNIIEVEAELAQYVG